MLSCREPEKIGFAQYQCPNHPDHVIIVPHSCKCRFCNTCGKIQTDKWICDCHKILPNVEYRHLTLTIPSELRDLFYKVRPLLDCLFKMARDMLLSFFDEKDLTPAITMVIHTFGRKLNWNPHLHIILSNGGITSKMTWKDQDFIPYQMLAKRWKVKLLNGLKEKIQTMMCDDQYSDYHETLKPFQDQQFFHNFFHDLYKKNWYTHLSEEKIDMDHTVGYIGRYSKRPVISEAKILEYDKDAGTVKIEYQDHKEDSPIQWTMPVFKFIALLIQHIPEKYSHQIRHYGLVANRISAKFKIVLHNLFGKAKKMLEILSWRQRQKKFRGHDPLICPHCNSELIFVFRVIFSRSQNRFISF